MSDPVLAQLAGLKTLPVGALKQKWRDLFEREPPPITGVSWKAASPTGYRNWLMAD